MRWIDFNKEKPQIKAYYLIWFPPEGKWIKAYWNGKVFCEGPSPPGYPYVDPTHWAIVTTP